tara:strand:+ start:1861 stop:2088 length:228 start_codon:yes stop_codon:yes gene_type:complete
MKNKSKEQIAIALFTGSIIASFILVGNLLETFIYKISILIIFIFIIIFSLKILLDKSTDLHWIGDIFRNSLRIKY